MLNYLDEVEEAKKIEKAVVKTLAEGKIVTRDMGGNASTMKMAKEVKKNLENL
jgi:3-isopropylmalate dehydrogenase